MDKTLDDQLDEMDWRLQAAIKGTFSVNSVIKSDVNNEAIFSLSGMVGFGSDILNFDLPNISALYLDLSYRDFEESSKYLVYRNFDKVNKGNRRPNNYSDFIYFLQKRMSSVFFAYSALDAFVEEQIKDDIKCTRYFYDKKSASMMNEIIDKKKVSTLVMDKRLWQILPEILKMDSCDIKFYRMYKEFKLLRDRLIHPKMIDRRNTSINDDSLWNYLIKKDTVNYAIQIKEVIQYFSQYFPKDQKVRWLNKIPF